MPIGESLARCKVPISLAFIATLKHLKECIFSILNLCEIGQTVTSSLFFSGCLVKTGVTAGTVLTFWPPQPPFLIFASSVWTGFGPSRNLWAILPRWQVKKPRPSLLLSGYAHLSSLFLPLLGGGPLKIGQIHLSPVLSLKILDTLYSGKNWWTLQRSRLHG